jgi:hypothetical protein
MGKSSIWLSVGILLLWAGWWFRGAPNEGVGFWVPFSLTWFFIHHYLTQVRHGEVLTSIATLERRLLLALGKYDQIPSMEWNLRQEEIRRQKENEEAIQELDREERRRRERKARAKLIGELCTPVNNAGGRRLFVDQARLGPILPFIFYLRRPIRFCCKNLPNCLRSQATSL